MVRFGERTRKKDFDRDAKNVSESAALVLIGLKKATVLGLNCGACGYETCREHAMANYEGLAESEMCLPYTIEELHRSVEELNSSKP